MAALSPVSLVLGLVGLVLLALPFVGGVLMAVGLAKERKALFIAGLVMVLVAFAGALAIVPIIW